jgi:hypothetical protein
MITHPLLKYSRAVQVQSLIRAAYEDDRAYMLQGGDKIRTSWMPFQLAEFTAMLFECVAEAEGSDFLEVGSGVGTKSLVARELFGLATSGIEYDETMATVAEQRGRGPVWVGDALAYDGSSYSRADIIWMYRPFRDPVLQDQLEQRIYSEMKSGAIIFGGALERQPAGFSTVLDDWDTAHRGAWKRP